VQRSTAWYEETLVSPTPRPFGAILQAPKPNVVVNCAAWTAVDDAESNEDAALAVKGHAVAGLAAACADSGASLVHMSTDYVFDGAASSPYAEGHVPAPRTAYGRTKLAGEQAVLAALPDSGYVVRTSWLYGAHGQNFVYTMMKLARSGVCPAVVDDQRGQPTWSADVARQILADRPPRPGYITRRVPVRPRGSAWPLKSSRSLMPPSPRDREWHRLPRFPPLGRVSKVSWVA
jgi:dTDP-4-dehydrorhamnose reductase